MMPFSHAWGKALLRLQQRLCPGAVILRYHRIADLPADPYGLCVSPNRFSEHLALIKRGAVPMQLRELVRLIRAGVSPPRRTVVVTFDDGYADNLYQAKPLLEQYEIPATVFVTTAYTLAPGRLPRTLNLEQDAIKIHAELEAAAEYSQAEYYRNRAWTVKDANDPTIRHKLFRTLHDSLKPLSHDLRWKVIAQLQEWSGCSLTMRNSHRPLSSDEVIRLAEGNLVEIGAHSDTHPVLSRLPAASQRDEIQQSKSYLEQILNRPVTSFAYPYGHPHDYTPETIAILLEAGFESACSTVQARVGRGADLFQLPRIYIGNWDRETFRRESLDVPFR